MKQFALLAALVPMLAAAEEGMWTFDNPPNAALKAAYGVELDRAWLDRVSSGTARLESGCTASFISGSGLLLTNHHCAEACIAQNSSAERDLLGNGFLADGRAAELACPAAAASVLVRTEDVTDRIRAAIRDLAPAEVTRARRAEQIRLEQACEEAARKDRRSGALKCEVVTLYQGGQYWLYTYKRYEDVRLVFAPEKSVAAFGGDVDNFQFPRWTLDMSLLRAYENGKPAVTPAHLRFDWSGAEVNEPVFVSGHPGSTSRQLTSAELDAQRDAYLPFWLIRYSELRGRMLQFAKTGEEAARITVQPINLYENAIKVRRKQLDALQDDALFDRHRASEARLEAAMRADPDLAPSARAFADIAAAQQVFRDIVVRHTFLEGSAGFNSVLFDHARTLVRAAVERGKPNAERLRAYSDARLPAIEQALRGAAPVYPDLEKLKLSFSLERMREWLGPDDPVVKQVFGRDDPDTLASRLVDGSRLADPAVRMALFTGGQAAVAASDDPMIRLAALVEADSRALYQRMEDQVEGPTVRARDAIAAARFKALGTSVYPDATFTLRFTYGSVTGWTEQGQPVTPFTRVGRMFERATGRDPFRLPENWLAVAHELDMDTPLNFTSTVDITGGNSGSPIVDARGDIVGLAFDGNIHSISGDYWYDAAKNRAIGVDVRAIRLALDKVYRAQALLAEIDGAR